MGQDIREMMRDYKPGAPKLSEGHQARFLEKLQAAADEPRQQKPGIYMWMRIAALFVAALAVGSYFYFSDPAGTRGTNGLSDSGTTAGELAAESIITLGDLSPDLKKVETYYTAGINVQLASLNVTEENKELVDSYMEKLAELDADYRALNMELNEAGPTEATVTALIENLQLRLELLFKLKNKLEELKNQNNENYSII